MKTIILLVFLILISGCSYKKQHSLHNVNIRLQAPVEIDSYDKLSNILHIKKINGVNYINTRDFVYSDDNGIYNAYAYHQWDEPLSRQVEYILVQSFIKSNLFEGVTNNSSMLSSDFVLECNIYDFKHLVYGTTSKVILNIELKLIDTKSKRLLGTKTFVMEEDTQTTDAKGALHAYNIAMERFINEVLLWIKSSI